MTDRHDRLPPIFASRSELALCTVVLALWILSPLPRASTAATFSAVAVSGDPAPDGSTFGGQCLGTGGEAGNPTNFDEPSADNSGDVVFGGCVTGPAKYGIFLKLTGQAIETVLEGGQTIDVGKLSTSPDDIDGPAFNNSATVVSSVRNVSGGSATSAVIRKEPGDAATVLVKQGDAVPGIPGATFVEFDDASANNEGDVAVIATYVTSGGVTKDGVFLIETSTESPTISVVAKSGDPLPHTKATLGLGPLDNEDRGAIDGPWINDSRLVAFQADTVTGDSKAQGAAFLKRPKKKLEALVLNGERIPGTGFVFDPKFSRQALNNNGTIGFVVGTRLLTKQLPGRIAVCLVDGTPAPGTDGGTFDGFSPPTIDDHAGLLTTADISDNTTNGDRELAVCQRTQVSKVLLNGDPKPGGGTWGFDIEEAAQSQNGRFVALLDENGSPDGVFLGDRGP